MPVYEYLCEECGKRINFIKPMKDSQKVEHCDCGAKMVKQISMPNIIGTRDSFGVGKEFKDPSTGQIVDTWKKWEQAGYRDARHSPKAEVRDGAKRKIEKITQYDNKKRFSVGAK